MTPKKMFSSAAYFPRAALKFGDSYHQQFDGLDHLTVVLHTGSSDEYRPVIERLKNEGRTLLGHVVVTKRSAPIFSGIDELEAFIKQRISGYQGLIDEWDVLVEVVGSRRFDRLPPDWTKHALSVVRKGYPEAKLWLNEYAIKDDAYWDQVLSLGQSLLGEGLDGIGVQCHVDLRGKLRLPKRARAFDFGAARLVSLMPAPKVQDALDRIKGLGLEARLSEVSVRANASQRRAQMAAYERFGKVANSAGVDACCWEWYDPNQTPKDGQPGYLNLIEALNG